jgi:clan AA aspartic protease
MGYVYAEITLKNASDTMGCKRGFIQEPEIRQATVTALVDTGAMTLVINEKLRQELGLEVRRIREVTIANDTKEIVSIADPVEVHWKNRDMVCQPWVLSHGDILLGAIPLEDMDLIVDPAKEALVGAHGEEPIGRLVGVRA